MGGDNQPAAHAGRRVDEERGGGQETVAPLVIYEIVTLPDEIDISNADRLTRELCAAQE